MLKKVHKKQSNTVAGYLLIAAGLFGAASRFIGEISWSGVSIFKLAISILAIIGGLWIVIKKK
jgi:hypothetical protein